MGFSVKIYLDSAISDKKLKEIRASNDKELKARTEHQIKEKQLQLFLYLRMKGKTFKVSAERKVTQREWDSKANRANPRFYKKGAAALNSYLGHLVQETHKMVEEKLAKGRAIDKDDLRLIVNTANNKAVNKGGLTFKGAYQEFIDTSIVKKTKGTITVYRTTLRHLTEFTLKNKYALTFDSITQSFADKFIEYLLVEANLTNNTVAKYVKTLKTFMNYCTDRKYTSNYEYRRFEAKEEAGEVYALSKEELKALYAYQFDDIRLEKVRDAFCFSCFTGLRFSDVKKLTRDDVEGDNLKILTKKTKKISNIPLNKYALAILEKYKDDEYPIPMISSQKTNDYLKEIAKEVGIDSPVRKVIRKGAEVIDKSIPKYQVVSFHMARKTFVTLSLTQGMSERTVKEISGHKKDENFKKYVAFTDDFKKKEINDKWNLDN